MARWLRHIAWALGVSLGSGLLAGCQPPEPSTSKTGNPRHFEHPRSVGPRLTGASYQPCREICPPERLSCAPVCPRGEFRHSFSSAVSEARESDLPGHAESVLTLAFAETEDATDEAIRMLEKLAAQHPTDARILSDLGAAYVTRAQRYDRPSELVRALGVVQRAVEQDHRSPAASFNQGLVHQLLFLERPAARAWRDFLVRESGSGWAAEAQELLAQSSRREPAQLRWARAREELLAAAQRSDVSALRRQLDPWRTAARLWVEDELLPGWGTAWLARHKTEARERLAVARALATELAQLTGDRLLTSAIDAIDTAATPPHEAGVLQRLAAGHADYGEAARLYAAGDFQAAGERYRRAAESLEGSPFRAWAELGVAVSLYQRQDLEAALSSLEKLRRETERASFESLLGRIYWMIALCQISLARPLEALASYRFALDRFEAVGERENLTNVHARLAETYRSMGEHELGWRHRYQALRGLDELRDQKRKVFILLEAAEEALELDLPEAALSIQSQALAVAREPQDDLLVTLTLFQHARASLDVSDPDQAWVDIEAASRFTGTLTDAMTRALLLAGIEEARGRASAVAEPARATAHFTRALELLPAGAFQRFRAMLHVERARACRDAGDPEAARADLEQSTRELDKEWRHLLARRRRGEGEELWEAYFAHRQEVFEQMIALLAEQGREEEAFGYAERARARDLLDLVADLDPETSHRFPVASFEPLSAAAVGRGLPPGVVLLEYTALDDRLLLWMIRRDGMQLHVLETRRRRLDERAEQIRAFAARRVSESDFSGVLAGLFSELLPADLKRTLRAGEKLVFIPDGPLQTVPFAALRHPTTGRFLIEDHAIATAPSATLYLYAARRNETMVTAVSPSVLLVGDPAFDPRLFPQLPRLANARRETARIAPCYSAARSLEGELATSEHFLQALVRSHVVHFAGHSLPHPHQPFLSSLVFAPSASNPGVLYARELLMQSMPETRLFVLSACSTTGGRPAGALGVSGLVRPILGAGVPAVVGSLWDVNDAATAELLAGFHQRFSRGEEAAEALRGAQLELLRGSNLGLRLVFSWAPFQVIGTASLDGSLKTMHSH